VRRGNRRGALMRAILMTAGCAVACALPAVASAATTPVTPTSLTDCTGNVSLDPTGESQPVPEPNLLDYKFSCDTGITAYSVIVEQQGDDAIGGTLDDYNPSPLVYETDGVTPSSTEAITCEGTTPSLGINCNTGTQNLQLTDGYFVDGSVDPVAPYCKHLPTNANGKTIDKPGTLAIPGASVQLVVTDYTGAQDGPFTLASTLKCKHVPTVVPKAKKHKKKSKHSK
jgi:hypothetical protein